jgi:hypothetical protein
LIAALPDELEKEIRGQIVFDQEMTIQLAPAAVTAGAAKATDFVEPELPPLVEGTGSDAPSVPDTTAEDTPVGDTTTPTTDTPSITGGGPIAAAPVNTTFSNGVPVWLVVLLVIAAFVLSRPLSALADRLLAARAGGACPYEER